MAGTPVTACIALGSNLGDRRAHLAAARRALEADAELALLAVSPLFETAPVGPPPQGPYLNAAALLETSLGARALLERLHAIEGARGRVRGGQRDAARTLDLDLLLYGDEKLDAPGLTVPHPRLHERRFVLEPLACIAAERLHPVLGETVASLAARARRRSGPADAAAVRLLEDPEWPSSP